MNGHGEHRPVMVAEMVRVLQPRAGARYIDATIGAGGYTAALLNAAACRVIGIDRDRAALTLAARANAPDRDRLTLIHGCFGDMVALLAAIGIERVDGVAFDLGVSSMQLDRAERGFSFHADGPLDMRMDPDSGGLTAADVVNRLDEGDLARLIADFGEERAARRVARAIVRARAQAPIETTRRLADIVRAVVRPSADGHHPATRTFQALRIRVNDELGQLDRGLVAAERLLAPGGRLCVVAFHSLEDRRVKAFLRARSGDAPRSSRHLPDDTTATPLAASFRLLSRRAQRPTAAEVAGNPRARSARLRAAERTEFPAWDDSADQRRRRAA